jgi:uncharacterized protein (DUF2252 family)
MRDLDQTVIGSPAHDVVRLALSLAMAVRASTLPGRFTLGAIEEIAHGYERALEAGASRRPLEYVRAPAQVTRLLRLAGHRARADLLSERIGGSKKRLIPIGRKFWPLTDEERRAVTALVASPQIRELVTSLRSRADDDPVALLDAAYWVKGCSSLGLWRCAALVRVGRGKKSVRAIIDLKEARTALAPASAKAKMPKHAGERVVQGARHLSPHLGSRIVSATVLGIPITARELLPADLKFELDALEPDDVAGLASHLGTNIGSAHVRQLTPARCATWLEAFRREHAPRSTAPSWLWAAVVDLVALHEGAYLEHCRGNAAILDEAPRSLREPKIVSHHATVTGDVS